VTTANNQTLAYPPANRLQNANGPNANHGSAMTGARTSDRKCGTVTTLATHRLLTVTVNPGATQAVATMTFDAIGQITRITRPTVSPQ
jgi:hypothetical protein